MEVYADIEGYEGLYKITSWGRVWSVKKEKFIRPEETEKGYLRVDLFDRERNRKHHKVHRLVAQAFDPYYTEELQVNHIDGNKQNNSITNLEMVTNAENNEHRKLLMAYAERFE